MHFEDRIQRTRKVVIFRILRLIPLKLSRVLNLKVQDFRYREKQTTMGSLVGATELSKALIEAGKNLLKPHSSTDGILSLLDVRIPRGNFSFHHLISDVSLTLLSYVDQDRNGSVRNVLIPSMEPLVSAALLGNPDSDVRAFVVTCLTEIVTITAPDAPFKDDQVKVDIPLIQSYLCMYTLNSTNTIFVLCFLSHCGICFGLQEIFQVTLKAFGKLADPSCHSYRKAEVVLDIVSRVRSFLVMVDLEFGDLILEMFQQFLKIIR